MTHQDKQVINEVEKALDDILFGSVELYVQEGKVTQITIRHIKKTGVGAGNTNGHSQKHVHSKTNLNLKLGT
ncbi:MAG: hypothetical protein COU25_01485 [Candidatus Levybacteria bacterium CG10_big_fil_rev_8_21_14_0_10_35_13]|nr:MAG: hypothetical protein COU25_01485 [Candidatus Levybacteria bacterium CG10_big_fil_rev_8_21_14_0_10_35_13]